MRSGQADPSNPWPHDMTISVNSGYKVLSFLLFVRAAWNLEGIDLPGLDPFPLTGDSRRPDEANAHSLVVEWKKAWSDAVANLSHPRVPRPVDAATRARYDAMTFEDLMAIGDPRRSGTFVAGIDRQALADWDQTVEWKPQLTSLEDQPERVNLTQLVPAWRAGLRTVVELPLAGDWARRISPTHLLLSASTRHNRENYGHALTRPIEPAR